MSPPAPSQAHGDRAWGWPHACCHLTFPFDDLRKSGGFPGGSVVKNKPANAGDAAGDSGSVPRSRRSPGVGNGNPLQCSCLENPMDRGDWRATVHGVKKSRTPLRIGKESRPSLEVGVLLSLPVTASHPT